MRKTTPLPRLFWADIIRVLAIFLVVLIHSLSFPEKVAFSTFPTLLVGTIAATGVPLFVMLSGTLLLGKKEPYKVFYEKRLLRLLIPWLIWTLIYTIFAVNHPLPKTVFELIHIFISNFLSFWFLPMVTGLYLLTPAIRLFVQSAQNKDIVIILLLWFFVVSVLPYFRDSLAFPLHVDNSLLRQVIMYSGYYIFGYFLANIPMQKRFLYGIYLCFFSGVVLTLGMEYFYSLHQAATFSVHFFAFISPGIILTTIGLFGMCMHYGTIYKKHAYPSVTRLITVMSSASLGVYFLHGLIQQTVLYKNISVLSFVPVNFVINAVILYSISFFAIVLLQRLIRIQGYLS